MIKDTVKNYTLYKLRFWIGYSFLALVVLATFVFAVLFVPGGVTPEEQKSALISASMQPGQLSSLLIVDAPYHLLQKLSLFAFNLNHFAIKLPSLIVGFSTAIGLALILRKRFSQTISIISAGIIVIAAQFISIVTTGTPDVMMLFWPVALLLVASYALRDNAVQPWAIYAAGIIIALGLLTPFVAPILIALALAATLHPRTRLQLRKLPRAPLITSLALMAISLGLIAYATLQDALFVKQLLYRSVSFSPNILDNLSLLGQQLTDFTSTSTKQTGRLAPAFGLTTITFALIGAYRAVRTRHTALAYIVGFLLVVITPLVLLNPSMLKLYIIPIALLVASGVVSVLNYWYKLFPRNPYARVFALLPVTILFASVILSGTSRYFYSYHYYAPLANHATDDLTLIASEINTQPDSVLLVAPEEKSWYRLYLDTHDNTTTMLTTNTFPTAKNNTATQNIIATRASGITKSGMRPTRIVASSKLHAPSDRIYIYKKTEK